MDVLENKFKKRPPRIQRKKKTSHKIKERKFTKLKSCKIESPKKLSKVTTSTILYINLDIYYEKVYKFYKMEVGEVKHLKCKINSFEKIYF